MKEVLFAAIAVASTLAIIAQPSTAFAASVSDDVALCAAALDAKGLAAADAFRPKFLKSKGSLVRKVSVLMIPTGDGASIEAVCQIKRGEVIDVAVKA